MCSVGLICSESFLACKVRLQRTYHHAWRMYRKGSQSGAFTRSKLVLNPIHPIAPVCSPGNTHKLKAFYMEVLVLDVIL